MKDQMIRVISSPSSSTIGFFTEILDTRRAMLPAPANFQWQTSGAKPPREEETMKTYVIRRERAWQSPEELEATAARSKQVAESDFPDDIAWIRSYVIAEPGGTLGTVCIYQASDEDAVRRHAGRVDMPADEILEVADTVVIRPDPEPEVAAG